MPRNRVGGPGSYNAICDVCGLKYKASELLKRWDGAIVCKWDWEPRHPQEFIRAKFDNAPLPFTRGDPAQADSGPTYACSNFSVLEYLAGQFNMILAPLADTDNQQTYTLYKVRTLGGTVHIPVGLTVIVKCTLEIGL